MESNATVDVTGSIYQAHFLSSDNDYVFVEPEDDSDQISTRIFLEKNGSEDDYDHCDDVAQIFLSPYKCVADCCTGCNLDDAEMSTVVSVGDEEYGQDEEILLHDSFSMISSEFFEDIDDEHEICHRSNENILDTEVQVQVNPFITFQPIVATEEITQDQQPIPSSNLTSSKKELKSVERRSNSGSRLSNKKRRSKRMKELKKKATLAAASEALLTQWTMQKHQTATTLVCHDRPVSAAVLVYPSSD
jgi:hypothetical protein